MRIAIVSHAGNNKIMIILLLQLYNFRKRPLPAEDDIEGMTELAKKLTEYNKSISEYATAIKEIDVPW